LLRAAAAQVLLVVTLLEILLRATVALVVQEQHLQFLARLLPMRVAAVAVLIQEVEVLEVLGVVALAEPRQTERLELLIQVVAAVAVVVAQRQVVRGVPVLSSSATRQVLAPHELRQV